MSFKFISPKAAVSKLRKYSVPEEKIECFRQNLAVYLSKANDKENEEYHKNLIRDLLHDTFGYATNTRRKADLAIYDSDSPVALFEVKDPKKTTEMCSERKMNCKAFQQSVLYFMREIKNGTKGLKKVGITNYNDFYLFDAKDFLRWFWDDKSFRDEFEEFGTGQLTDDRTKYFYERVAKPKIQKWIDDESEVNVVHFSPADFKDAEDKELVILYKILWPEFLLSRQPKDINELDERFYRELLHIIGLEEAIEEAEEKKKGKKLVIRRLEKGRNPYSLLEYAIFQLEEDFTSEDKRFEIALDLVITWVNRLLFLKLVESQQLTYQNGSDDYDDYKFLCSSKIKTFDDLNELFFKVLAVKPEKRDERVKTAFTHVPYLNSSLFEPSQSERYLKIRGLKNGPLNVYVGTVLKDGATKLKGQLDNLEYIFRFLDAYDFSGDASEEISKSEKTLINASVLGKIFEKINGYKEGSYYTPSGITEYMARETIELAVVRKFNETKGWCCKNLAEVEAEIADARCWKEANGIINRIHVCDPAVGSGHFPVSVLNRFLEIKSRLNVIHDADGERISNAILELHLENDEISVVYDGNPFVYNPQNSTSQRIQETLFNEKRDIIENCLFGVDINPISVSICRMRLWVELLKNSYYTKESRYTQLNTLPNIDINIKRGDSLLSNFPVVIGKSADTQDVAIDRKLIKAYKCEVDEYKRTSDKQQKHKINDTLNDIKSSVYLEAAQGELFPEMAKKERFEGTMEWMLEFPEVMDEDGRFLGFDVVIANPPYISTKEIPEKVKEAYKKHYRLSTGQMDLFTLFIERSFALTGNSGLTSFIVPDSLVGRANFEDARRVLIGENTILRWVHVNKVFKDANVSSLVYVLDRDKQADYTFDYIKAANVNDWMGGNYKTVQIRRGALDQIEHFQVRFATEKQQRLFRKISEGRETLKSKNALIWRGEETGEGSLATKNERGNIGVVVGGDVNRYSAVSAKHFMKKADIKKEGYERPKIVIQQLLSGDMANCTIDTDGLANLQSVFNVALPDDNIDELKFLLGILNSSVCNFLFQMMSGDKFEWGRLILENIKGIPIPAASAPDRKRIVSLVDKILSVKQKDPSTDTSKSENEVDVQIYQLYGLTPEEIETVENA